MDIDLPVGHGRKRRPSLEGVRFRALLVQLCKEYVGEGHSYREPNGRLVYGVGAYITAMLGVVQNQVSQYLNEDDPKYAEAASVEKFVARFASTQKHTIDWPFFKEPSLKDPHYRDYLKPIGQTTSKVPASAAPIGFSFRHALAVVRSLEPKGREIGRFLDVLAAFPKDNPSDDEIRAIFMTMRLGRKPSAAELAENRDAAHEARATAPRARSLVRRPPSERPLPRPKRLKGKVTKRLRRG